MSERGDQTETDAALPDAPLAMPKQVLEPAQRRDRAGALLARLTFGLAGGRIGRSGV